MLNIATSRLSLFAPLLLLSGLLISRQPNAHGGVLSIVNVEYSTTESSFSPPNPFFPFPPFNQGSVNTVHRFTATPFSATISAYSEVSLTISAPVGMEFAFFAPAGLGSVSFMPTFNFDGGGSRRDIFEGTTSISFQALNGPSPTLAPFQSNISRVADTGSFFYLESEYRYSQEFSFQSMTISAVFPAGGSEFKNYTAWSADLYAFVSTNTDVGPLSSLRAITQQNNASAVPEPSTMVATTCLMLSYVGKRFMKRRRNSKAIIDDELQTDSL
jgi:hypothetical protein